MSKQRPHLHCRSWCPILVCWQYPIVFDRLLTRSLTCEWPISNSCVYYCHSSMFPALFSFTGSLGCQVFATKPSQFLLKTSPVVLRGGPWFNLHSRGYISHYWGHFRPWKTTHGNSVILAQFCGKSADLATLLPPHMLPSDNNIIQLNRGEVPNCNSFNGVQNAMLHKNLSVYMTVALTHLIYLHKWMKTVLEIYKCMHFFLFTRS